MAPRFSTRHVSAAPCFSNLRLISLSYPASPLLEAFSLLTLTKRIEGRSLMAGGRDHRLATK